MTMAHYLGKYSGVVGDHLIKFFNIVKDKLDFGLRDAAGNNVFHHIAGSHNLAFLKFLVA